MNREATPKNKKTRFGQISDFNRARNELDEESYGELVMDVAQYEGDKYGSAQDIARAFHQEDPVKYNRNQMTVRDAAKEFVTDMEQPEWAWDILSFYSKDMGVKMLDVPSGGHHKGLLVTDPEANQEQKCYLYAKDEDGISDIQHVERYSLNIDNAESIGYSFPSEVSDRVCLMIEDETVAALEMDYNDVMVPTDRLERYFKDKVEYPGEWMSELKSLWNRQLNRSYSQEDLEEWDPAIPMGGDYLFGLKDLVEEGMFFNKGMQEFEGFTGNLAFEFPDNWWQDDQFETPSELYEGSNVVIVDSGEYFDEVKMWWDTPEAEAEKKMLDEDSILDESQKEEMRITR